MILRTLSTSTFLRPSCEVYHGEAYYASMTASPWWWRHGLIMATEHEYEVQAASLEIGGKPAAKYSVLNPPMGGQPTVNILDMESARSFKLQQHGAFTTVLVEAEQRVAHIKPSFTMTRYTVEMESELPSHIILLSIWLTALRPVLGG